MGRIKSVLRKDRAIAVAPPPKTSRLSKELRMLATRRESLGRRIYNLYRIYDSLVLEGMHARGFTDVRPVHTDILRSVEIGGSRLTDVAASCNITKQAASQIVNELVGPGYLSLRTVPHDTRVRMVAFTDHGMDLLLHLGDIFTRINRRLAAASGEKELERFGKTLDILIGEFDADE